MIIPGEYQAGYPKARAIDPVMADRYMRHTTIGDPAADAVIDLLNTFPRDKGYAWLERGIEGGPDAIADAPELLRDFFTDLDQAPAWFDRAATRAGGAAFYRNGEMFILGVTAAIMVEGFSTMMSRSFSITGRMVDAAVKRLQQNSRHIVEIMLPGGLDRQSDGWKLSLRARMVHARIRNLLKHSPEWDAAAWGTPLSAAHISLAVSAFSALLLKRVGQLGVRLTAEERESFVHAWRYSGHLMGVQPELDSPTEAAALHLLTVGSACEPPPGIESVMLANAMVNSAPLMVGIKDPVERGKWAGWMYEVSRGLMGDSFADQLNYPPARHRHLSILTRIRWSNRADRFLRAALPALARARHKHQFRRLLDISYYGKKGLGYAVPHNVHSEKDTGNAFR
jgi:hypothetical protein